MLPKELKFLFSFFILLSQPSRVVPPMKITGPVDIPMCVVCTPPSVSILIINSVTILGWCGTTSQLAYLSLRYWWRQRLHHSSAIKYWKHHFATIPRNVFSYLTHTLYLFCYPAWEFFSLIYTITLKVRLVLKLISGNVHKNSYHPFDVKCYLSMKPISIPQTCTDGNPARCTYFGSPHQFGSIVCPGCNLIDCLRYISL